jgi:acetyltransferase-like isoleucine patch superfamily enzyme
VVTQSSLSRFKTAVRPVGLPVKRALRRLARLRLRLVFFTGGVEGIAAVLRRYHVDHARILRDYGAKVAPDAIVIGPLNLVNMVTGDLSNLTIESGVHVGSEVFIDLVEPVTIERGATLSMRSTIITHFDIGHGPLKAKRPRETGPVRISAGAYLGVGSIVLHGVTVGREAIVGAGALVRSDVPDYAVVGGVPARPLTRTNTTSEG